MGLSATPGEPECAVRGSRWKYTLDLRSTLSDRPEGGGSVGMTLFQQLEMGNGCSRVD